MKYLEPSFSTLPPAGQSYRDNHDRIFGKKEAPAPVEDCVPTMITTYQECPTCRSICKVLVGHHGELEVVPNLHRDPVSDTP